MSNLRVLVVGASIAGPMTAYWLARAGATVTVIERFQKLRTSGQQIDIRTSGVTVMRKIPGMEESVRAKVYTMDGAAMVRSDGRPFAVMSATGDPDQQALISEYEIYRGDLARILMDLTKDNDKVNYVFGEQIASLQQKPEGPVTVNFANGLPTTEYDLVVACDGATSRTRAMGLECGVRDHAKALNCWAAYFTVDKDLLEGSKMGQGYNTVGGRMIALGPHPWTGNRVTGLAFGQHPDAMTQFRAAAKQGDDALKNFVAKSYRGTGWKTDEILSNMMDSKDFYASESLQVRPPSLSNGKFVLVGDAGYAPGFTGTGTTLAITGAYVLAGEIAKSKGDLAEGLRGYEERMKPIITDMQKIPTGIHHMIAPQTAWGLWLRNLFLSLVSRITIPKFIKDQFGRLFAAFGKDKYNLPDYEWVR